MLTLIRDRILRLRLQRDENEVKIGFLITGSLLIFLIANIAYLNYFIISNNQNPPKTAATTYSSPSPTPTPVSTPIEQSSNSSSSSEQSSTKDYFFNLGTGTNQSTEWTDVQGALSTFNIAQYSNIKEVRLETNINVPTANGSVSVRLFNKTDNYAVWNSERTVQAQTKGDLIISQNIVYDKGPKLYQIQMKSQLGVPTNLIQSRIHITTN